MGEEDAGSSPKRSSSPEAKRGLVSLQRRTPLAPSSHDVASIHLRRVVPTSRQRFDSADHAMKLEADKLERARAGLGKLLNDDATRRPRRSSLVPGGRGA
jgi:hypothetical protein